MQKKNKGYGRRVTRICSLDRKERKTRIDDDSNIWSLSNENILFLVSDDGFG